MEFGKSNNVSKEDEILVEFNQRNHVVFLNRDRKSVGIYDIRNST